ncbi:MAG: pyruvate kinase [Betaproteobacteria bacterium TMED82]|nr:MAG: pyruvate kinase [Betaproteobacteria bacterium TMED82]|tara:strand:+ start:9542 stop:11005 length:1464 start_codon:yes stop_codon:yes gene_type:complete
MKGLIRATKIVATLGPATNSPQTIEQVLAAGVDIVRMNFSHGSADEHVRRASWVHEAAHRLGRDVGILVDLQGPKIRVGIFENGEVELKIGQKFVLDINCKMGDRSRVGLDYRELVNDVQADDILLLNDGHISLKVTSVNNTEVSCIVLHGGVLSDKKGINRQGGGLSAPALTNKDIGDIKVAASMEADYVAVSFPKSAEDINYAKELLKKAGSRAWVIAKIERVEAIRNLQEILEASNGLMVARGDLATEVGEAAVPALQKKMIRMSRDKNRLAITATQMMESMIKSPVPTRAEVSDVANAVLDGTDAVMLSAETATGKYPNRTVEKMSGICLEAEKFVEGTLDSHFLDRTFERVDQSIAMASLFVALHLKIKAIASFTQSGSTALWISRLNSGVPIYALTPEESSRRRMALYRDVQPIFFQYDLKDREALIKIAEQKLVDANVVSAGDLIVITIGEPIGQSGGTNTMKIVKVSALPADKSKQLSL